MFAFALRAPTITPASDGRPSAAANSGEIKSLASCMPNTRWLASYVYCCPSILKNVKPVFLSRTANSYWPPQGRLSMTSCRYEAFNAAGRAALLRGVISIELGTGPRSSPFKTRMAKNVSCTASKVSVAFRAEAAAPFRRFKSISIETFPLATIIFSKVPLSPS